MFLCFTVTCQSGESTGAMNSSNNGCGTFGRASSTALELLKHAHDLLGPLNVTEPK